MSTNGENGQHDLLVSSIIESAIKISLLGIMFFWCFQIIKPFISLILWGGILAVALYPACILIKNKTGKSKGFSSLIVSIILLSIIIVPMAMLSTSMINTGAEISENFANGTVEIPAPSESVREWPLVGEKVYNTWDMFNRSLNEAAEHFKPQIKEIGKWVITMSTNTGLTLLLFIASIILSAVLMLKADSIKTTSVKIAGRMTEKQGEDIINLSIATIRSVAQGVIGIAVIQAAFSAPALILMDVPAAGVWALAILILAIVQLPAIIVIAPIIFYVFSVADSTSAIIFSVYLLLVGFSDTFLKPMLLGRGVDVPMIVILIGAIGGMIFSGIVGLFTGAVVLALGYTLVQVWINGDLSEKAHEVEQAEQAE
jgi:predicted PurR-regulated permease PerM